MNNIIIITLLLLNFGTAYLYAQGQKNAKQEDSPKSGALKKALIESEKIGQEYIIKSSANSTQRIVDVLSVRDNARIKQLQLRGLKSEYDTLYSILLNGVVKKDTEIQSYYTKILPSIAHTQYSGYPEDYRRMAWDIVSAGYTIRLLEEFQGHGINPINIYSDFNKTNPWQYLTLFSPLIVVGRIDSVYLDTSLHDNSNISYKVNIRETLKGDERITNLIIRENVERSPSFKARKAEEYILFLYRNRYEYSMQNTEQINQQLCSDCYFTTSFNILLPYNRQQRSNLLNEKEKSLRSFCKEYAPLFQKMRY